MKPTNKIIEYVKTWKDVVRLMSINLTKFENDLIGLNKGEIAYRKLLCITKVLNEDWVKSFNNNEYYYEPYFIYNKENGSFSCNYYHIWYSFSDGAVGLGLYYRTPELAKYCGTQFIELWNDYLRYNKPFDFIENLKKQYV